MILSELAFASMGAAIKVLSAELPTAVIVFLRSLAMTMILLPWLLRKGPQHFKTQHFRWHVVRSVSGVAAMFCFFYAIAHIPLAEAYLLKMTTPLFIPLIALLWLGEAIPKRVRWAVWVGFIGVALITRPGFAEISLAMWLALFGGLLAGIAKTSIRRMSGTEPTDRIVFYFGLFGTLAAAIPAYLTWVTPTSDGWLWLLAVVAGATAGQFMMTRAYALAPAGQISPFSYSAAIFASLYGYLFWGELLSFWTIAGASLIVVAGLALARGNHLSHKRNLGNL